MTELGIVIHSGSYVYCWDLQMWVANFEDRHDRCMEGETDDRET
jgi:hypothetical protein